MSEEKHTPGPWRISSDVPQSLCFGEDTRFWVILDKDGYSPAIVPPWDAVPPIAAEEAKANARLIAAAPELLEALEWIFPLLERVDSDNIPITQDDLHFGKLYAANVAIAKAKGEA